MIIEQAFLQLPEILHGSGYQQQDYEAGIVGALSLSVLQVLNGHNTANPIACLQHERLFRKGGRYLGAQSPRYLRADLHVNVGRLLVANKRLSQYGWRHNAWVEAKFLRNQTDNGNKHSPNKTSNVANFLADIIRLATLIPENNEATAQGRYFLHVYDSDPQFYLTFRSRVWMKALCQPGEQKISLQNLENEPATVKKLLGDFSGLSVDLSITNTVLKPLVTENPPCYWMHLTRIDAIKVTMDGNEFKQKLDRSIEQSSDNALNAIASQVASLLHIDPKSSESEPPIEAEGENEDQAEQEAPADG